jgi:hypothetical protein
LNFPLQIYFDVAAALLAGLLILVWSIRRRRRDRLAIYRIEPDATDLADGIPRSEKPLGGAPGSRDDPLDYPRPVPADRKPSRSDAEALAAHVASARDYKGFKICLNEKRPGLWIAAVSRSAAKIRGTKSQDAKMKKNPAADSQLWITPEFYQLSAALADARAAIDRGAVNRQAAKVPIKSLQE